MPDFTFRFVYAHFHRLSPFRCIYSILYEVEMFTQLMPQSCNSHNSLSGPRTALSLTRSLVTKLSSVQLPFITWSDRPCWMLDGHSSSLSSLDTNRLQLLAVVPFSYAVEAGFVLVSLILLFGIACVPEPVFFDDLAN